MAGDISQNISKKNVLRHPSQRFLFTGLVCAIVLVLVVSFFVASMDSYRQHTVLAENEVLIKAKLLLTTHEQWLEQTSNMLRAMAKVLERQKTWQDGCRNLFPEYINISPGIDRVMLLNAAGQLMCATKLFSEPPNFAKENYFVRALTEKKLVVGNYIESEASGRQLLPVALPIMDQYGDVQMVLVTGRGLDWLEHVLFRQYQDAGVGIAIVTGDGRVLVSGSMANVDVGQAHPSRNLLAELPGRSEGVIRYTGKDKVERIVAFARLEPRSANLFVLASQPTDKLAVPVMNMIRDNLLLFVATMLIIITALWVSLGHWVLAPLRKLADTMARVRSGKTDVRVESMGPSKEFFSIGEDFNAMLITMEKSEKQLRQLAENDPLLGIPNRRLLDEALHSEWRRMSRDGTPLSLLMIDVDLFKRYNDHYGHQAGDDCLRRVSTAICQVVNRPADIVARYGGEVFVVLLPATDTSGALRIARAIQIAIKDMDITHATSDVADYVTLSIGVSCTQPNPAEHVDTLLAHADQAMYKAKTAGRNRIEIHGSC